jgi:uncharacterized protein (DUF952 family)
MNSNNVYKIMTFAQWQQLKAEGTWAGSEVDLRDGFVHLSTWEQVPGTLEKHFFEQKNLLLVGVPIEKVQAELRWEISRGGQEFPHLYRELRLTDVSEQRGVDWEGPQTWLSSVAEASLVSLQFPLYLLHHGPGYVSLVDVQSQSDPQPQSLALFGTYERAAEFVEQMAGFAGIKAIRNARELQWLLSSLKEPVVEAVLDPAIDRPEIVGTWRRTVRELLEWHIQIDRSPWNYPVYLLRSTGTERGWSLIRAGGGKHWFSFVAMFTSDTWAENYRRQVEDEDGPHELVKAGSMQILRAILEELGSEIAGVAVNPEFEQGVRKCENCLEIGRLLGHYLTVVRSSAEEM